MNHTGKDVEKEDGSDYRPEVATETSVEDEHGRKYLYWKKGKQLLKLFK